MIDRDEETRIVKEVLEKAKVSEYTSATFLEFYGLAGIGKTYLLDYNRGQATELDIPSARVDVGGLGQPSEGAQVRLTDEIVNQLQPVRGGPAPNDYRRIAHDAQLCRGPIPDEVLKRLAQVFTAYLRGWLDSHTNALLLIFDDTDRFPTEVLKWLNQEVFAHLTDFGNLVVVFGGRSPLQSGQLDRQVRSLLRPLLVKPFPLDDTCKQMEQGLSRAQYQQTGQLLQDLTHGHPISNDAVIKYLNERQPADVKAELRDLAQHLRDEVIQRYVFSQVDRSLQQVILLLAYPRRFDASLLAELIRRYGADLDYGTGSLQAMLDLITDLTRTPLATYEPGEGGYKLDPLLAKLIRTGDLLTSPQRFVDIHRTLATWHLGLAPDPKTGSDVRSVGDAFYHLLWYCRGCVDSKQKDIEGAKEYLNLRLQSELRQRYSSPNPKAYERTNELRDRFASDAELETGLPGVLDSLRLTLADFIAMNRQAPRAILTITDRTSLDVSFNVPDQTIVINGYSSGLSHAGKLELRDALADLDAVPPSACQRMFGLCLPLKIQDALRELTLPLQIVTNYADQPWELMHDRSEFLCLKLPVGRMPAVERQPRQHNHIGGARPRFLLIADPTGDLPGAREEIAAIRERLNGRADTFVLEGPNATLEAFFNHLLQDKPAFDVIHYAGHAEFDRERPQESLLNLNNGNVRAYEIERMLNYRPVVFLNACTAGHEQSGELPGSYMGSHTEGLVTSFLLGGARACVGPLWRVPDGAARDFAITFYDHAIRRIPLGEALRQARLHSYSDESPSKVWAAYVLYGNPTDQLLQ